MAEGKILILGSRGTLGTQLMRIFGGAAIGRDSSNSKLDVMRFSGGALESFKNDLQVLGISALINCVAYNDVDGAESNKDAAFKFNSDLPGSLAHICNELGIPFIHFSTNYVFDGEKDEYAESDAPHPLSVYAKSKYEGEVAVQNSGAGYYLIRTSVLFGPKGQSELAKKSFVDLMLDLSSRRESIEAVTDEINSITYAVDLAARIKLLLEQRLPFGIYHIINTGQASWFDFAKEIFKITGKKMEIIPVPSSGFPRPALRPSKAVLINTKLPPLRPWQLALAEFLNQRT